MPDELTAVRRAMSMLSKDDDSCFMTGKFFDLQGEMIVQENGNAIQIARRINQDVFNVVAIIERLHWMQQQAQSSMHLRDMWRIYAGLDIEHFHVEVSSMMDHVAAFIAEFPPAKGQTPRGSFERLINWIDKPENVGKVGSGKERLIRSATWSKDLKRIRNHIVHWGAKTAVFAEPSKGILFQVYTDSLQDLIADRLSFLAYNDNGVMFFERYAALYLSHLFGFFDDLADTVADNVKSTRLSDETHLLSPGFCVVRGWLESLSELISREREARANNRCT